MSNAAAPPLAEFIRRLADARAARLPVGLFCEWARQQAPLLSSLPAAFETVLVNLLDRLESSALFAEESCSFSQTDLWNSLELWASKAQLRLQTPPSPSKD
jgi:hypothetical protein